MSKTSSSIECLVLLDDDLRMRIVLSMLWVTVAAMVSGGSLINRAIRL